MTLRNGLISNLVTNQRKFIVCDKKDITDILCLTLYMLTKFIYLRIEKRKKNILPFRFLSFKFQLTFKLTLIHFRNRMHRLRERVFNFIFKGTVSAHN